MYSMLVDEVWGCTAGLRVQVQSQVCEVCEMHLQAKSQPVQLGGEEDVQKLRISVCPKRTVRLLAGAVARDEGQGRHEWYEWPGLDNSAVNLTLLGARIRVMTL